MHTTQSQHHSIYFLNRSMPYMTLPRNILIHLSMISFDQPICVHSDKEGPAHRFNTTVMQPIRRARAPGVEQ